MDITTNMQHGHEDWFYNNTVVATGQHYSLIARNTTAPPVVYNNRPVLPLRFKWCRCPVTCALAGAVSKEGGGGPVCSRVGLPVAGWSWVEGSLLSTRVVTATLPWLVYVAGSTRRTARPLREGCLSATGLPLRLGLQTTPSSHGPSSGLASE